MKSTPPILMVRIAEPLVFIKISGRATCQNSVDFKSLITGLISKGFKKFVMDLTECLIMDSTFLGVLAGTGVRINQETRNGSDNRIRLLNPNSRVSSLLDNLGVLPVFEVATEPPADPATYQPLPPQGSAPSRDEIRETSLEAHKFLMGLNEENYSKFIDVKRFLEETLGRSDEPAC